MQKVLLTLGAALLATTAALGQEVQTLPEEGGGLSFKTVMNVVYGVLALALFGLGIWYFKLKRDNE